MSRPFFGRGGITLDLQAPPAAAVDTLSRDDRFTLPNPDRRKIATLGDLALPEITMADFPVVAAWRDKLFAPEGRPEICDELPRLLTQFWRDPETTHLDPAIRRAKALYHIFTHKTPLVRANDLLPGQTTTSFVGPVIYCDTIGLCIWPELSTVASRQQNPFHIRPEVAERLNREIFPFWLDHHPVQEAARYSAYDTSHFPNRDRVNGPSMDPPLRKRAGETPKCQELMERVAFYLSDKATCVSHTVPDFQRLLTFGLKQLTTRMHQDMAATTSLEARWFLDSVITVFDGAVVYARNLARAAAEAGNPTLAALCRRVPEHPATTLHEAVAALWICYHLLLQENTNFGLSLGRLDQLLQPYYLADWQKLSSEAEKAAYHRFAVALICHFFLRCSDHVPLSTAGSETLFAGSGSNQALTVGGVRMENGRLVDAVNDMTYIILKATELLAIRDPNVHARYHKEIHGARPPGAPAEWLDPYLARICQVNITTRATPALHGDAPVIASMGRYYADHDGITPEEALADACDYAAIGCIEQNSAGRHYGNSGSSLVVLPAVLELAIFGGKHRSDGVGPEDPDLFQGKEAYTTPPLLQMSRMNEFIAAFRSQLVQMASHVVQNNNYLGRTMERERSSPFLSGLFTGPTNLPGAKGASFRDVAAGGAKYNSAGIAIIGLADVIDSFCVLDTLVFRGKMTGQELLAAMAADYREQSLHIGGGLPAWLGMAGDGGEGLTARRLAEIRRMIRLAPKYGAGVESSGIYDNRVAVHYTQLLTRMLQEVFYNFRTHRGGRYLVGYWSMTNHAGFGMLTQATPNGRQAKQPFASGITPCANVVKADGSPVHMLDHMRSVTSVQPDTVQNGYTYNLSLTTSGAPSRDTALFGRAMAAFLSMDGMLAQMCVSSTEDLRAAHAAASAVEQPGADEAAMRRLEPYRDLMIRVAGYSAYFVTLSPSMRQEIIARANFGLATGQKLNPP